MVDKSAILKALREGDASLLESLLDAVDDVNCDLDGFGKTALHEAAMESKMYYKDPMTCAQLLIDRGADPDMKNSRGETPLHVACRSGNYNFVRLLVSKKVNFNIDSKTNYGVTALMICAKNKHQSILDIFIEAGANVNEVSDSGKTALHFAVEYGYPACSKSFETLLMKSDINLRDNDGLSAFQLALELSQVDHAFFIFDKKSDVNVYETDRFKNTIVHTVIDCEKGDYLITIANSCHFDLLHKKNKLRMTPMHEAMRKQFKEGVRIILMRDTKKIPVGCPLFALFISIIRKDEPSLKSILFNGVAMDDVDSCGRGPLQWAVMMGFPSGVDMLLSKGVNVNQQDKFGISALHFAALMDNDKTVTKLLSVGAEVNLKDKDGRSPLHYACLSSLEPFPNIFKSVRTPVYSNTSTTIVILMRAGCLLDLQDGDRYTPLDLALRCHNSFAVNALLIWGAKIHIGYKPIKSPCYQADLQHIGHSARALFYHTAKLKQANIELYNGNRLSELEWIIGKYPYHRSSEINPVIEQCEREFNELARLKNGNFYLHDVLTAKKHSFIFDNELRASVYSTSTEENFPFYGPMLQATFMKSELRYQRINEAVRYPLSAETKSRDVAHIPDEVKRMIFSFLPDEDLVSFIKAA